eukprot:TRINITY_DN9013_c0_g1_i1.p1 TRINITY_DN9013_c0_g1~~TRINITY_DN9013_c0_g1_i1.p1  ORF type:complete len:248 (+),score=39.23 TRINITY_DN9013_c0_g1_i1:2-745(+)
MAASPEDQIARFLANRSQAGQTPKPLAQVFEFNDPDVQVKRYLNGEKAASTLGASVEALPNAPVVKSITAVQASGSITAPKAAGFATLFQNVLQITVTLNEADINVTSHKDKTETTGLFNVVQSLAPEHPMLGATLAQKAEVMQWCNYSEHELANCDANHNNVTKAALQRVNTSLQTSMALCGSTVTLADFAAYHHLARLMIALAYEDRTRYPNLLRWLDFTQQTHGFVPARKTPMVLNNLILPKSH